MTYFFRERATLVDDGHLYRALPPLYRMTQGDVPLYARADAHREELQATAVAARAQVELSRPQVLADRPARCLRAPNLDPAERTLLRVMVPQRTDPAAVDPAAIETPDLGFARTATLVETLMGRRPELRFAYIQKIARFARDLDV